MKSSLFFGAVGALAVAQGCVSSFSATDGSTSNGGAATSSSIASMDVSASSSSGTGGATTGPVMSSSSSGVAAACPDEHGAYSITPSGTTGCGVIAPGVTQCIKATGMPCSVMFVSKNDLTAGGGIDGTVSLDDKGDFKDANLTEAGTPRTGCTGTWTAASKVMTVECGGSGTGQSCSVTLTRTGECPP